MIRTKCNHCEDDLILGENWTEAQRVKSTYTCMPCRRRNDNYHDAVRSMAHRVVGSQAKYRSLTTEERAKVRETATRMYDLGADFSIAASNEVTTREGFVYAITNKAWPGYVKVGRAFDPESRLRGYQTSSPFRDYELQHAVYFEDCYFAEREMHARLQSVCAKGEWFLVNRTIAIELINQLRETI